MGRKRFLALVMALTMLFTLMAPALTFATGTGSEEETPGAGTSEVTEEANEQGSDTDPDEGDGAGNDAGDTNTGADNTGDTGTGDVDTGDVDTGDTDTGDTGTGDVDTGDTGTDETGTGDTGTGDVDTGDTGTGDVNTGDDENTDAAQDSDETDPTNEVLPTLLRTPTRPTRPTRCFRESPPTRATTRSRTIPTPIPIRWANWTTIPPQTRLLRPRPPVRSARTGLPCSLRIHRIGTVVALSKFIIGKTVLAMIAATPAPI